MCLARRLTMASGFPLSFGVFQEYYSGIPQFANSPFITYVGSIATGITYFGAPIMAPLVKRYANYQIHMVWAGWVLCLAGLIGGSFVDTVGSLVATQGVIYGGEKLFRRFGAKINAVQSVISSSSIPWSAWSTSGGSPAAVLLGASCSDHPEHRVSLTHSLMKLY